MYFYRGIKPTELPSTTQAGETNSEQNEGKSRHDMHQREIDDDDSCL